MFAEIDRSVLSRWYWMSTRIRCALQPDEPRLLDLFLGETRYLVAWERVPAWHLFEKCYQLLLDTGHDIALPWHWRIHCLNHAYRPFHELQCLARSAEQRQRLSQLALRLASQDMQPSLSYHEPQEGIEND
ncbi:FagA protein [Pseudomonas schmalbachii]|uniref:FagA protein n=1 Tax=Pseudomonas schmalbachii TaxID=2816993 RepID=A0ABS3TN28_9PSED|nr:FagA protein [Pseudomonas schmalbachii]MBO3275064.1 FagA protein [Pseudomonas schmalbachii]